MVTTRQPDESGDITGDAPHVDENSRPSDERQRLEGERQRWRRLSIHVEPGAERIIRKGEERIKEDDFFVS